ncbi:MAG: cyclic nucleotide-binding domain-containing protein [Deltaproteobacteria bacterium]|nr:cyclic nucleotide-binding domain-containing protein [Deltaproteobacteria bacterium]
MMLPTIETHTLFRRAGVLRRSPTRRSTRSRGSSSSGASRPARRSSARATPAPRSSCCSTATWPWRCGARAASGSSWGASSCDVIGEQACLDPAPRSATVTATSTSVAAELTRAELDRMSRELPRVASLLLGMVIQGLTERLRSVDRRIESELESLGRGGVTARRPSARRRPRLPTPCGSAWPSASEVRRDHRRRASLHRSPATFSDHELELLLGRVPAAHVRAPRRCASRPARQSRASSSSRAWSTW